MKFLATTYWNNEPALKCQLAAMILALRGRNVERAFWTQGPRGVGQSLNTDLIANTFGSNHSFVDMNIYFTPDEFRKQAEGLIGKCVVTGQEVPSTERSLREDLYKKHMTGEPIALQAQLFSSYTLDLFHRVETVRDEPVVDIPGRYRRDLPIHDETHSSHITKGPIRTCGRARQDVLPWGRRHFLWVFPVGQRVEGPEGPCSVVTVSDCVHNFLK